MRRYADYISEIQSMVQDNAAKLSAAPGGDVEKILAKAVTDYAHAKPFTVRKKVQGNGTHVYALAGESGVLGDLWRHGYSSIREIEYPIGYKPMSIIDRKLYELYDDGSAQDGSNIVLRFIDMTIGATEFFVVEFTAERVITSGDEGMQNFPDTAEHFSNITTLASAYACQRLAAVYAQSSDAAISADVVNYNDKSAKYQALAKQYMRQYNIAVYGSEDPVATVAPAMQMRVVDRSDSLGNDYVFHRRRR